MADIQNQVPEQPTIQESGDVPSSVLNLPKDGHYKITKSGQVKLPRRLLHCSDGVYEEYSTSEDEEEEEDIQPVVDPKTLTWGPYLWYYTTAAAWKGLAACDFLGEKLAWFFGITSPRFQYALDELERMKKEEEEQKELEEAERKAELEIVKTAQESKGKIEGSSSYESATLEVDNVVFKEDE